MTKSLIVLFASAFVLALFWFVAKTVGKLRIVKNSPTPDDVVNWINGGSQNDRPGDAEDSRQNGEPYSETVRAFADAGKKLDATKAFKEETGVSLMEAKRAVEAYLNTRTPKQ